MHIIPAIATLLFLLTLVTTPLAGAAYQVDVTQVESLAIDLWPDYDRPEVLVLMTGSLAPTAALPARVTLPLPPNADVNAVARISAEGTMSDDIDFTVTDDSVSLVTPDQRFRVEYYMPYESSGSQRTVDFEWQADLDIERFEVVVQQPAAGSNVQTDPAATSINQNDRDGLNYHILPLERLAAGQRYSAQATYDMVEPVLTINASAPSPPVTAPTVPEREAISLGSFSWPQVLAVSGLLLIVIAVVWQLAHRHAAGTGKRPRSKPAKPRKKRQQQSKFCHECGASLQAGDQFCRDCGTAVKQSASK